MHLNKKIIIMFLMVLLASCVADNTVVIEEEDIEQQCQYSHFWNTYKWPQENLTLEILDKTDNIIWGKYIYKTLKDWSVNSLIEFKITNEEKEADIVIYEKVLKERLGSTNLDANGYNEIFLATIDLDIELLEKEYYTDNMIQNIVCHEFGHALGLYHNDSETDTCMNTCAEEEDFWICLDLFEGTTPNQHDFEVLDSLYNEGKCYEAGFYE